jgi:MarR family transcriptional regulator, transcriptional regulator for hemolysin
VTTSPPQRTARDLTGLLNRAGHLLSIQLAAALEEADLTPRMQCVLVHAAGNTRTQVELAELADLDKTTMVATVDELERRGFAERVPSPSDRRARIIRVTKAGQQAAARGQRIVDRVHAQALGALVAGEREGFIQALALLAEADPSLAAEPLTAVRRRRESTRKVS